MLPLKLNLEIGWGFIYSGKEYGMLVEGDIGKLTFQGTRYHGFERIGSSDEE